MSSSYGHAYLTSYGWRGSGTGLRVGAIDRPLAIPPKKNLNGLGMDRDEAFPFWDHLFTAASKAITIKVAGSDDEDPEDPISDATPLRRTTTGIISNRRPISGTPASASASGTTTPDPDVGPAGRSSLVLTAKREAAKRGLYSRFFRGPVLGPDNDPSAGLTPDSPHVSLPVLEGCDQDNVAGESGTGDSQKSEVRMETREERRERKRLKKERRAARAKKKTEKAERAKKRKERLEARERRNQEARSEENNTSKKKVRKHARALAAELEDIHRIKKKGKRKDTLA